MKRLLILMASVLLCTAVVGQEVDRTEEFRQLYVTLSRAYAKNPDDVANLIDMARYYSHPDSPQRNLATAATHLVRAEALYTAWLQDRGRYRDLQKLIKKGITLNLIRQQHQTVIEQAELYVRTHAPAMGTMERETYLATFADNSAITNRIRACQLHDDYLQVCNENTIEAYYQFLLSHPGTAQADSAQAALALLATSYFSAFDTEAAVDTAAARFPASSAMQHAAMRQKSRIAYYAACQANTQTAYASYLKRYPRGDDYLDALARLQALQSMDYGLLRTPMDYAEFALTHSDSPLADSALAALRRMVMVDHNQEAATLYLQRFPLDEHYSAVYKEYYSWFSADGNRQPIAAFAADNPDYPFLMAVRSDLARSAVIDSFDLTKPFVEADIDRMTDCIHLCMGRKAAFVALQRVLQGQIARKEWANALLRLQQFAICFEELNTREYNELAALLAERGHGHRTPLLSAGPMHHLFAHPDGTRLYYTVPSAGGTSDGTVAMARRSPKGKNPWVPAGRVTILGTTAPVTAFGFYDDGRRVLLGINDDIWSARVLNDTLWTDPKPLPRPVNTLYVETDAYMLPDGSGLLLASDRPGGHNVQESGAYFHGDTALATDLYFIPWHDGQWGEAVNLGLPVNSPYCERSPLLSRNMKTLYFVTDARGLGYGDVYTATRNDIGDWSHWSTPVNLGRECNGSFDEASIAFMADEQLLLLTSRSPHGGNYAASTFTVDHDTADAHRTVTFNLSQVLDVARGLDIVDPANRRTVHHLAEEALDTLMPLRLYKGKPYVALVTADWLYVPAFSVAARTQAPVAFRGYDLDELRKLADPLPMPLVQFYPGTARLLPMASAELDNVVRFIRQHAGSTVKVSVNVPGTDDRQSYDLSLSRAKAIRSYIVAQGIDPDRINVAAYGNTKFKRGLTPCQAEVSFQ